MPASLLESQLATLEPPRPHEGVIELNGAAPLATILEEAISRLDQTRQA